MQSNKEKNLIPPKARMPLILGVVFVILFTVVTIYLVWSRDASQPAIQSIVMPRGGVRVTIDEDGFILFEPPETTADCMIFYCENKVAFEAYAPLAEGMALNGVSCAITKMKFDIASFEKDAALKVMNKHSEYRNFFVGGHGKGGEAALKFAEGQPSTVQGVILMGTVPSKDFSAIKTPVLSIRGSSDGICTEKKCRASEFKLPSTVENSVITGANHSYFGCYGIQVGDLEASIDNNTQIGKSAEIASNFIKSVESH